MFQFDPVSARVRLSSLIQSIDFPERLDGIPIGGILRGRTPPLVGWRWETIRWSQA